MSDLTQTLDAILDRYTTASTRVPGVSAAVTNREGTIYTGARGVRNLNGNDPFEADTVCAIFSTTKAIATTACLQLVEEGLLDLDAPASDYLPQLADVQVLEGFDSNDQPMLRVPKRAITTRHLLTHTAGFTYDFFSEDYTRLANQHGQPWVVDASWASIKTPLLFDPGERWEYGTNIDWAGMVVEAITGKRLGDVMQQKILAPLGMNDTAFTMTPSMLERQATIHAREDKDGSLIPLEGVTLPQDPELHMGGHGLYGTASDYAKFIRMWLNDGRSDNGEAILKPETVEMASRNHLQGDMKIKMLPGIGATETAKTILPISNPRLSNDAEFFPGMPKSWALSYMINEEDAPTGRPAGALAWAGLANLYYWIDRKNGIGGYWASQIFPFADPASVTGYLEMETAVYQHLARG
ncbi:MAG: serine hydrolase domain-containing protein [Oceanobacter sp.]